jgi:hypothetical protein
MILPSCVAFTDACIKLIKNIFMNKQKQKSLPVLPDRKRFVPSQVPAKKCG